MKSIEEDLKIQPMEFWKYTRFVKKINSYNTHLGVNGTHVV